MPDATALSCAPQVNWLPRFGATTDITSDRGRQFTSGLWAELSKLLGQGSANFSSRGPKNEMISLGGP